jgi:hypothetical protein
LTMILSRRQREVYTALRNSRKEFTHEMIAQVMWPNGDRPKEWNESVNRMMLLLRAKTQNMEDRVVLARFRNANQRSTFKVERQEE